MLFGRARRVLDAVRQYLSRTEGRWGCRNSKQHYSVMREPGGQEESNDHHSCRWECGMQGRMWFHTTEFFGQQALGP